MPKYIKNSDYGKFRIYPTENLEFEIKEKISFLGIFTFWTPVGEWFYDDWHSESFSSIEEAKKEIDEIIKFRNKVESHMSIKPIDYP